MWCFYLSYNRDEEPKTAVVLCSTPWYVEFLEWLAVKMLYRRLLGRLADRIMKWTYKNAGEKHFIGVTEEQAHEISYDMDKE